jgi:hypothetical protein
MRAQLGEYVSAMTSSVPLFQPALRLSVIQLMKEPE